MIYIGTAIAICFVAIVAYALTHKYNPQILKKTSMEMPQDG